MSASSTLAGADDEEVMPLPGARRVERAVVQDRWERRRYRAAVVVATVACAALGAVWLSRRSAWYDEASSLHIAAAVREHGPAAVAGDAVMPGYHLLLSAWTGALGDGDAAARSLSLVAAVATVPVLAALAFRLAGRRTAVAAAVVLTTSASVVVYAEEARSYALAMLATTATAWALVAAFQDSRGRQRWWRWPLAVLLGAGAAYTHVVALLVVPALLLVLATAPPPAAPSRATAPLPTAAQDPATGGRPSGALAVAAAAWLLLVTPLLVALSRFDVATTSWIDPDQGRALRRSAVFLAGGAPRWAAGAGAVLVVVVVLAWLRRSVLDGWPRRTLLVPLALAWLVLPLGAAVLVGLAVPVLVPRATLVCLPAVALLIATALDLLRPSRLWPLGLAAVVAVQAVGLAALPDLPSRTGWREASAALAAEAAPDDAVIVVPARERVVLEHYLPGAAGPVVVGSTTTAWLLTSTATPTDTATSAEIDGPAGPPAPPPQLAGWEAVASRSFERLTLVRYERRDR